MASDLRHELGRLEGALVARAIVRRETYLLIGSLCASAGSWAAFGLVYGKGAVFSTLAMLGGAAIGTTVLTTYAGLRAARASRLLMHAGGHDVHIALVGDDLEVVAQAGLTRMRATRAALRRLRVGALPAARVR